MNSEDIVGRYVRVDGTRVHYDELGEGTPIVLIHTLFACSLEYTRLMPLLAERGFHAIAPDLPGNSRSYPPGWRPLESPREVSDFLLRFIETVCGDERPAVAGCSIGANLTIDLVARNSSRLLAGVAFEGAVYTPTVASLDDFPLPAHLPSWHDWMERCALESLGRDAPPELVEELRWQHRFTGHVNGMLQTRCWTHHDLRGQVGEISCPLLVLAGEEDFYVPSALLEHTKREIPACEVRVIEGVGHYPIIEDPELVADLLAEWVRHGRVLDSPRLQPLPVAAPA